MENPALERIWSICSEKDELEASVRYLTEKLMPIIREGESVLICFPREKETDFGTLAGRAVERCGGMPVFWEKDLRWITLLRLSFVSKASTVIATPLVMLGLSKLAAEEGIPLYFFNVVLAGYPCLDWMMDGIEKGMDCKTWGVFGPGIGPIVSGVSCQCGRGIHIREDAFDIEITDEHGDEVVDGTNGHIVLSSKREPDARFRTRFTASIMTHKCPCGEPSAKLVGIEVGPSIYSSNVKLAEELLYWSSILDCHITRNEHGLTVEVVCFQGEKIPKLPSCAKLIVRAWNPETDIPMSITSGWANP